MQRYSRYLTIFTISNSVLKAPRDNFYIGRIQKCSANAEHFVNQRKENIIMATFQDFMNLDIRVGTIIDAQVFEKAKKPAYQLKIDFGKKIGVKKSSAQITEVYKCEELIGKQVLAVVNFPPRQIADFMSEVLVLGTYSKQGVVLIKPDMQVENGDKLG